MASAAAATSSLLRSFQLEHLPEGYTLHATLFTSLANASFLHQQLLAGNSDFEYAFIDAAVVSFFLVRCDSISRDSTGALVEWG